MHSIRDFLWAALILFTSACTGNGKAGENERRPYRSEIEEKAPSADPMRHLNLDSVKEEYGKDFMELREIVNRHDPIDLLGKGAPEDEYDPEVKTLIVSLDRSMSEEAVHDRIYHEFRRWFGSRSTTGPKEQYRAMSEEIHQWLQKRSP